MAKTTVVFSGSSVPAQKAPHANAEELRLTLGDGSDIKAQRDLIPDHVWQMLAWHGLKQKLVDGVSAKDLSFAQMQGMIEANRDMLYSGDWSRRGSGGSATLDEVVAAVQEVAQAAGAETTDAEARAYVERKGLDEVRKHKAIAQAIRYRRTLAAASGHDDASLDDLLG